MGAGNYAFVASWVRQAGASGPGPAIWTKHVVWLISALRAHAVSLESTEPGSIMRDPRKGREGKALVADLRPNGG